MPEITHHFVDNTGKTHIDTFKTSYSKIHTLEKMHVIIPTANNANLLIDIWHALYETNDFDTGVYVVFPTDSPPTTFEEANNAIRAAWFEPVATNLGGFKEASETDVLNARVLLTAKACSDKYKAFIASATSNGRPLTPSILAAAQNGMQKEITNAIVATSNHGLWKRVSWIHGINPLTVASIIQNFVDPMWYLDKSSPRTTTKFCKACIVVADELTNNDVDADSAVMLESPERGLWMAILKMWHDSLKGLSFASAIDPSFYFARYALRHAQKLQAEGVAPYDAVVAAMFKYGIHLLNFIYLSWMDYMYSGNSIAPMNETRFFAAERAVAKTAYNAAVS